MTTPSEQLQKALAKIEDPLHWCQRSWAQDREGGDVDWSSQESEKWCAVGAIHSVWEWDDEGLQDSSQRAKNLLLETAHRLYRHSLFTVNDGLSLDMTPREEHHAMVLRVYREAIKQATYEEEMHRG